MRLRQAEKVLKAPRVRKTTTLTKAFARLFKSWKRPCCARAPSKADRREW